MSGVGVLVLLSAVGMAGVLLAVSGWLQPAPTLSRVLDHLQRVERSRAAGRGAGDAGWDRRLADRWREHRGLASFETDLRLIGRSLEQHVVLVVASAVAGLALPAVVVVALQRAGWIGLGWYLPLAAASACGMLGPLLVHLAAVERAAQLRNDLRYQVSAYLDLVTMLLAGNTGYEGALEQAAQAGDGRLFAELRRRMREAGTRGRSLTAALEHAGRDLGLDELEQIAAAATVSAAEGAPVARTLAAKCATLRAALATEQESEARLRTSRLTTPIVGMALIFMALVIYPALSLS